MQAYEIGMMKWEACAKELGGMSKSNFYLRYEKWKGKGAEPIDATEVRQKCDKDATEGVEEAND